MGKLTSKLTLTGSAADYGAAIALTVSKDLTVQKPFVGISKEVVTTTGASHKLFENIDARRFVYVKHTGVDSAGASTAADLHVETYTDNASGEQAIMVLKSGEWAFFPWDGGNAIVAASTAGTPFLEYAIFES